MCEMNDFHFRVVLTRTHTEFWHILPFFFDFPAFGRAGWRYDNRAGNVCLANGFNPIFIGK